MSHEPPVPQGNQSPYPLREPPHAKPVETAADRSDEPKATPAADHRAVGVVLVVAALVAAGAGVAAYLTTRRHEDQAKLKPAKRKRPGKQTANEAAAERKPSKTATKSRAAAPRKRKSANSDNPAVRGERDAGRIALSEEHEIAYWTSKFGVDHAQLQAAVDQVGHGAKAVTAFFASQKADDQA